jgi:hypothetical protein
MFFLNINGQFRIPLICGSFMKTMCIGIGQDFSVSLTNKIGIIPYYACHAASEFF